MKEYIDKLITIEFSDRKDVISGFLIDFSDEWILLKNCPVDFFVDGFIIIRNKNIDEIYYEESEKFREKVIRLKGLNSNVNDNVPLENIRKIFEYLDSEFGIFQFYKKSEKAIYPGKLNRMDSREITIDWIDLKGNWSEERTFKLDKIRIIEFENDYLKSLKMVADIS